MHGPAGVGAEGKGARTRAAILESAVSAFRRDGYTGATLAGIAEELGITRSAVLHHFTSKATLLREAVEPFVRRLDDLLDDLEARQPITHRVRRRMVGQVVDLVADHREVAVMLTVDRSVNAHLDADLDIADRAARFVGMTVEGSDGSPLAAARSLAALGSVVRPLAASDDLIDFDDPAIRRLLVDCALAVLRTPLPVDPAGGSSRGRGGG